MSARSSTNILDNISIPVRHEANWLSNTEGEYVGLNQYVLGVKPLGYGAPGTNTVVYKASINSSSNGAAPFFTDAHNKGVNKQFAIKTLNRGKLSKQQDAIGFDEEAERVLYINGLQRIEREVNIMKMLQTACVSNVSGDTEDTASTFTRNEGGALTVSDGSEYFCQMVEVIDDNEDDTISIVMEFAAHGPVMKFDVMKSRFNSCPALQQSSGSFDLTRSIVYGDHDTVLKCDGMDRMTVFTLFGQLSSAVAFLHSNGIAHRDIKPENILINGDCEVRLADFGSAELFENATDSKVQASCLTRDLITHTAGTMAFWAPEMISDSVAGDSNNEKSSNTESSLGSVKCDSKEYVGFPCLPRGDSKSSFDHKNVVPMAPPSKPRFSAFAGDMWACGVTLHCMLFQQPPFSLLEPEKGSQRDPLELFEAVCSCSPIPVPLGKYITKGALETGEDTSETDMVEILDHYEWSFALLRGLLDKNPSGRLKSYQVLEALNEITV